MKFIQLFWTIVVVCSGLLLPAQNKPATQPKLDLSGSFRVSMQSYQSFGEAGTHTPFVWSVSGSPLVSVMGVRFPMNFTYRDSRLESNLAFPLSRFSASPSWKWGRLYLGQQSMRFTNYTLSGRDFSGVGLELNPGILRLAAVAGSFRDLSTESDSLRGLAVILPTYRRKGMALKLGVGNRNTYLDFMVVKIKDREEDYRYVSDAFQNPKALPEDNLVGGVDFRANLFKALSIQAHIAGSVHTSDHRPDSLLVDWDSFLDDRPILRSVDNWITPRANTRWGMAINTSANLKLKPATIGIQYSRVDPYYQSLGTFFVRNDLESWTASVRANAWKRKLQVRLKGGVERNNLANFRRTTQKRWIGSMQMTLMPSPRMVFSANLSNFQLDNQAGFLELNDTLRLVQVTRLQNVSFLLKGPRSNKMEWSVSAMANHQQVLDQSPVKSGNSNFNLINANLAWNLSWKTAGLRLSPNVNYRKMQTPIQQDRWGVGLRISQRVLDEKLRVQASGNYQFTHIPNEPTRQGVNVGMSIRYQLGKHHRLGLRSRYLNRNLSQTAPTSTLRSQLSYTFTF